MSPSWGLAVQKEEVRHVEAKLPLCYSLANIVRQYDIALFFPEN